MMGTMGLYAARLLLVSRGGMADIEALHLDIGVLRIGINTPAKPMAAPSVKLKLRGFFIARYKANGHSAPKVAP